MERDSEEELDYRQLFENAHDGILLFDPESEIVLEANPRACEIHGLTHEEFVGTSLEARTAANSSKCHDARSDRA